MQDFPNMNTPPPPGSAILNKHEEYERRFLVKGVFPREHIVQSLTIEQEYYTGFLVHECLAHGLLTDKTGNVWHIPFPSKTPVSQRISFRQRFQDGHTIWTLKGPMVNGRGYEQEWP